MPLVQSPPISGVFGVEAEATQVEDPWSVPSGDKTLPVGIQGLEMTSVKGPAIVSKPRNAIHCYWPRR